MTENECPECPTTQWLVPGNPTDTTGIMKVCCGRVSTVAAERKPVRCPLCKAKVGYVIHMGAMLVNPSLHPDSCPAFAEKPIALEEVPA